MIKSVYTMVNTPLNALESCGAWRYVCKR